MKKHSRKLNLNRETLIPLSTDTLDGIHGGALSLTSGPTGPSLPQTRQFVCDPMQTRFFCTQSGNPR